MNKRNTKLEMQELLTCFSTGKIPKSKNPAKGGPDGFASWNKEKRSLDIYNMDIVGAASFGVDLKLGKDDSLVFLPIKKLYFHDCNFEDDFDFSPEVIGVFEKIEELHFHKCIFLGSVSFNSLKLNFLIFFLCKFESYFNITNSQIHKCDLDNTEVLDEFHCHQNFIKNLRIRSGLYSSARFYGTYEDSEVTKKVPKTINIENIEIDGNLRSSNLSFSMLDLKELELNSFENGMVRFSKVDFQSDSIFKVYESDLSGIYLNDVDFRDTKKLFIGRSDITGMRTTNVSWNYNIEPALSEHLGEEQSDIDRAKSLRDTFRQLKYSMEMQGNHIQALEFYAREMEMHYESLALKDFRNWAEIFILFLGKYSNNFGLNWWIPILWYLSLGAIFLSTVLYAGYVPEGPDLMKEYSLFLNPFTREFNITNNWTMLLDFLWRATAAYLIYQIVVAFRKYSRKI